MEWVNYFRNNIDNTIVEDDVYHNALAYTIRYLGYDETYRLYKENDIVDQDLVDKIFSIDLTNLVKNKLSRSVKEQVSEFLSSETSKGSTIRETNQLFELVRKTCDNPNIPNSLDDLMVLINRKTNNRTIFIRKFDNKILPNSLDDTAYNSQLYWRFYYNIDGNYYLSSTEPTTLDETDYFTREFGLTLEGFCMFFQKEYSSELETVFSNNSSESLQTIENKIYENFDWDNVFDLSEFKKDGTKSVTATFDLIVRKIHDSIVSAGHSFTIQPDLSKINVYTRVSILESNIAVLVSKYDGQIWNPEYTNDYDCFYTVLVNLKPYNTRLVSDWLFAFITHTYPDYVAIQQYDLVYHNSNKVILSVNDNLKVVRNDTFIGIDYNNKSYLFDSLYMIYLYMLWVCI